MLLLFRFFGMFCLVMLLTQQASATDNKLTLGTVLDDQGNPITLPNTKVNNNLRYTIPSPKKSVKSSTKRKLSSKKVVKQSRKKQLASRNSVANDPGCRWLNSRMSSLEQYAGAGVNVRNRHYQQELSIRQQEWQCMKCGAEGPSQGDHALCQYRR